MNQFSVSDMEKITEKFYQRFKKQHGEFLLCVGGIADQGDREWYTSLMLNRLTFLYFIQQKGFLAGDKNYLLNRLMMHRRVEAGTRPAPACPIADGQESFASFYRSFLLKLFYDGLNKRERSPSLERLLGNVPYLNSDLFAIHVLERKYPAIQIADSAFEALFAFFQVYDWHLDDGLDVSSCGGGGRTGASPVPTSQGGGTGAGPVPTGWDQS
jgi:hypothetical protein